MQGAKGVGELADQFIRATSASSLFENTLQAISDKVKTMTEASTKALDVQKELAAGQRNWQDFLKPGDNVANIGKRIEEIGAASHMGTQDARQAFGQIMAAAPDTASTGELLADFEEVAKSTKNPGFAARRTTELRDLRRRFPGMSREQAAAEFNARGWKSDQVHTIEGLQDITHGADKFSDYAAFTSALGEDVSPEQKLKIGDLLLKRIGSQIGSESLRKTADFMATPRGHAIGEQIAGEMERGEGEFAPTAGRSELRNPRAKAALKTLLRNGVNFNQPGASVDAMRAQQAAIGGQATQQLDDAGRDIDSDIEAMRAGDPRAMVALAKAKTDEVLAAKNYMESGAEIPFIGGTSLRARLKRKTFGRRRGGE